MFASGYPLHMTSGRSISEVSADLGLPIPTIRSWERRYGFPEPHRTDGKHRRYSAEQIEALRVVRDEITRGHRAAEAVSIARSAGAGAVRNDALDRFAEAADRLDAEGIRDALVEAAEVVGLDRAIVEVALPGIRRIGDRWRAGLCDVGNEHVATHTVQQWLAGLLTFAPPPYRPGPLLLACAPTELHSIGIEAFGVILARRGWACRLLGPMTPVSSLVAAARTSQAAGVVVTAQRSVGRRGAIDALVAASALRDVGVFYGGNAFTTERARAEVPGTYLGTDLLAAAETVAAVLERPPAG